MRFQLVMVRFGIALVIAFFGLLVCITKRHVREKDESWIFDAIEVEKSSYDLDRWFRNPGRAIDVSDWPKTVGEIRGYETGFVIHVGTTESGRSIFLPFHPDNPVHWTVHRVNSSHRWVAYGVTYYGSHMGYVVAKRSGKESKTPEEFKRFYP